MNILIEAAKLIVESKNPSAQLLQRELYDPTTGKKVDWQTSQWIMFRLECAGIISEFRGGKPREILITEMYKINQLLTETKE